MLSYLHAFHAGGWADVFKHAGLALLARGLQKKPTPFAYLETHAGRGLYDLDAPAAQKTAEHQDGIVRLGLDRADAPRDLEPYLDAVRAENQTQGLRFYPGSPRVVRHLLRPGDRMVLAELHPREVPELKRLFARDPQVGVHAIDGYTMLKSFLPPREKRGLVFIDPSYEIKTEYDDAALAVIAARRRFPEGVFALWYPVLPASGWSRLLDAVCASGVRKVFRAELLLRPPSTPDGLNGSGLLVVNPPWKWNEQIARLLPWLRVRLALASHKADAIAEWLVPE
ncbi:MAG: 23S rRNA (adenine(2030)-N(6))-methyltransferase RlmJ [Deltaproteobacteria bacterium]|nr:23S rRNA (adenine(2030)-N(6))-methyltransferase RlmJ [Deltaproteobacteria bacterium]